MLEMGLVVLAVLGGGALDIGDPGAVVLGAPVQVRVATSDFDCLLDEPLRLQLGAVEIGRLITAAKAVPHHAQASAAAPYTVSDRGATSVAPPA